MSKIKFVVVSKDDNFKMPLEKFTSARSCAHLVSNNKDPLTKVYNHYLTQMRQAKEHDTDCIVFMHADVTVDIEHLLNHIGQCKDKYDVIGLCGCSRISVSQSPLNWFCGSRPYPNDRWGCVTHGELGNMTSYFSHHSPDVSDHEVACIDGLCIIFTKKAIDSGICFDETFKFDQYDTDISFQAVMRYGLRLGVIVEKSLQHFSVGKSILTKEFLQHELDFRNKWKLKIPENSSLQKMLSDEHEPATS